MVVVRLVSRLECAISRALQLIRAVSSLVRTRIHRPNQGLETKPRYEERTRRTSRHCTAGAGAAPKLKSLTLDNNAFGTKGVLAFQKQAVEANATQASTTTRETHPTVSVKGCDTLEY